MNFFRIVDKVWRDEEITDAELDLLLKWLLSREGRKQFEAEVTRQWWQFEDKRTFNYDNTLNKIHARMENPAVAPRRSPVRRAWWAVAAILAGVAGTLLFWGRQPETPSAFAVYDGVFGSPNKAILTTSGGTHIVMDNYAGSFVEEDGAVVKVSKGELAYDRVDTCQPVRYHEIYIPVGGEYKLTLSDGSVVWLNSETRLKYPVQFTSGERRLVLEGEAYFEVLGDTARPFVVESLGQQVMVLGTRFNLSAYPGDLHTMTTLAEGRVRVFCDDGREMLLTPGQQAQLDKTSGELSVHPVSVSEVLAWKEGYIVVEDQTLEQTMQKLARWYDVQYRVMSDVPRNMVFRGIIPKYDLHETLKKLEMISQLKITLDGNIIDVRNQ